MPALSDNFVTPSRNIALVEGMIGNRHSRRMMQRERAHVRALPVSLRQVTIFLLALMALAIQSFVVQTHIHRQILAAANSGILTAVADDLGLSAGAALEQPSSPRDQLPGDGDPTNCPLCQSFAHSGQFVHGGAVLAYIPAWVSVDFIVAQDLLPTLFAASHNWYGRAPPLHTTKLLEP